MQGLRKGFVLMVVASIALLDFATGVFLLVSPEPWLAHGPSTIWRTAAPAAPAELTLSLFRRIGAFSLYAGTVTLVWAWFGRKQRALLTALLVTYSVVGVAFAHVDDAFFQGTPYLVAKRIIGAMWTLALVAHFLPVRTKDLRTGAKPEDSGT